MSKEAKSRILINGLLQKSGWRFFDEETGPANIALEAHVKLNKKVLDDLGDDFEKTTHGYVDYLFEMATGTGKTLTVAAIIKLFMRTGNAKVSLTDVRALDQWREFITEYIKDYVSLNAFAA